MRMGGDFIEILLDAIVDPGELLAFLPSSETAGAWESDGIVRVCWPREQWSPAILAELENALRRLGVNVNAANVRLREIADRDWNEIWARSIRPVAIGERVLVRQSWNPVEVPAGMVELVIDPKRAFGSGYHETTRLLVEWIAGEIRGGETVLDVGTGSGILAMTALRCGAARAVGVDNDDAAIECARENASLNGFGSELDLRVGLAGMIGAELFDLIVANIDRKTLLECAWKFRENLKAEGRALLSGLLEEDCPDLSREIESARGRVTRKRSLGEWAALEVRYC